MYEKSNITQKTGKPYKVKIEQKVTKDSWNALSPHPDMAMLLTSAGPWILFTESEHQYNEWPQYFDLQFFNRCRIMNENFVFYIDPLEEIAWW